MHSRTVIGRIGATVLLTVLALGVATPAAAQGPPLTTGAVFNDPYGSAAEQDAIKDHIISTVHATPPGETIRAALYALTDQDYTDALVDAHQRGVGVRVVLDSKYSERPASQNLIAALGRDTSQASWVTVCHQAGACIAHGGVNPINHNKFFLFTRVGTGPVANHVVLQTSANETALNTEKYFNNAYTVVGNRRLYDAYLGYFDDLAAMVGNNAYFTTGRAGPYTYYFFPQEAGDVVVDILGDVTCTGNHRVGTPDGRSIVRVAAFALHRAGVADALIALAGAGCRVELLYAESNQVEKLTDVPNLDLRRLKTDDGYLVHSKYFLIEGGHAGHREQKLTFTGSHNLDFSSLRENDEAMMRIDGDEAHDAYRANFRHMFDLAVPVT
jgi:phosphatidylserine/phosphatidylglycerophosphate/cardiolipin synthase-like enzyme